MAFESLTEKLQNVFKKLRSKGRLTEEDVKIALKEVKMALLEADVNFKVVKQFTKSVQERAVGQDVMNGLNPGQMVIKIVNEEMVKLMGSETTEIALRPGQQSGDYAPDADHRAGAAGIHPADAGGDIHLRAGRCGLCRERHPSVTPRCCAAI